MARTRRGSAPAGPIAARPDRSAPAGPIAARPDRSAPAGPIAARPVLSRAISARNLPIVMLVLLSLALSLRTVQTPDLWWHLASGRWMVEHRAILDRDVFTFTSPGIPWINRTWLGSTLFYLMYAAGGVAAVCIFTAVFVTAVFAAVAVSRGAVRHPVAFTLLGLLVLAVAHIRFLHRPALLSDLLAPATILVWLAWREGRWRRAAPLVLAVVQVIWTHLHGGFVLGLLIAGAFLVDAVFQRASFASEPDSEATPGAGRLPGRRSGAPRAWLGPAIVLVAGVAAVLLTPWRGPLLASLWGFVVRLAPAFLGRSETAVPETAADAAEGARNIVAEWVPTFSSLGRRVLGPFFWVVVLLAALALGLVVRYWLRRRSSRSAGRQPAAGQPALGQPTPRQPTPGQPGAGQPASPGQLAPGQPGRRQPTPRQPAPLRVAESLLLLALVILTVTGLRFVGTLALAGFPLLWEFVRDEMEAPTDLPGRAKRKGREKGRDMENRNNLPGLLLAGAIALLLIAVVTNGYYRYWRAPTRFGIGVTRNLFPERLADWMLTNRVDRRFFNGYDMGGYLGWRFGPTQRVFTDSRVVSETVYADYLKVCRSTAAWPEMVTKYRLDGAILDKRDGDGMARLYGKLRGEEGWAVPYEDGRFALVIRKR